MATDITERAGGVAAQFETVTWTQGLDRAFECRVLICPEDVGGYSAYALRLPGVASQGESIDEALENICDAFVEAIRVYCETGAQIPWQEVDIERTKGCFERWMLVNV
jgi:predicted RNase H-like HicB family nuclease